MDYFDYDFPNINWASLNQHYNTITSTIMRNRALEAVILGCRDNIRAATGFRTIEQMELGGSIAEEYAALIDREGNAYVFTPWWSEAMAPVKKRFNRIVEFIHIPSWTPAAVTVDFWTKKLGDKLEALKARKIGFDHMSSILTDKLKQRVQGASFHSVATDFLEARMIKHEEEIKLLEQSAAVNDGATTAALNSIGEGVTEYQVAAEILKRMYEAGAESVSHCVMVSGSRSFAELAPTSRVMRRGDPVTFDLGIYWKGGYGADEARTGFIGKPPQAFMEAYSLLKETLFKTAKAMTPGRKASEIDSMLRKPLLEAGYTESPYANGHGIGLRLMELPQIDKPEFMARDYELKENMCIAIEPETSAGDYVMKLENVILIKPGAGVSLNKALFID